MSTDGLTRSLEHLREMLADCPAVRTWMGAGDTAAARERIFLDSIPDPADVKDGYSPVEFSAMRPLVLLGPAAESTLRTEHEAVGVVMAVVNLVAEFEWDAPETVLGRPTAYSFRVWREHLGKMLHEVFERTRRPGFVAFSGLALRQWDHATAIEAVNQGPWMRAVCEIRWRGTV